MHINNTSTWAASGTCEMCFSTQMLPRVLVEQNEKDLHTATVTLHSAALANFYLVRYCIKTCETATSSGQTDKSLLLL